METITLPLRALIDPVGALPRAVESRRWVFGLFFASLATALSGVMVALRLDAARVVIPKLAMTGELMKASEREIAEAVTQAQRVALVGGVAKGLLLMPLLVLLLATALKVTAWLIGKKALFLQCFSVAALTMLPIAVFHLVEAVVAASQPVLTPAMVEALVPSSLPVHGGPHLMQVAKAVDFFNLWAAALMGLGFAAASGMKPWKGLLLGLFLYALYAGAFLIGVPALAAGMPGGPGGH